MIPDDAKKLFVSKFISFGDEKFYKFLIDYSIDRIAKSDSKSISISPELELMDYHDRFLVLYRKDDDVVYLEIAKLFRKAAHRIYGIMLNKSLTERNSRFLSLVE